MEPFLAILRKYCPDYFRDGVRGWDGCRCGCHGPHPFILHHIRKCCSPTHDDFDLILELYRSNLAASREIQAILDSVLHHIMSQPFGFLDLALIYGGR
jgi:hypothetical protein